MNYRLAHGLSVLVTVAAFVCAALVGAAGAGFHPTWLTPNVVDTAGVLGLILAPAAGLLPSALRTPGRREQRYLDATVGNLPADLEAKYRQRR